MALMFEQGQFNVQERHSRMLRNKTIQSAVEKALHVVCKPNTERK